MLVGRDGRGAAASHPMPHLSAMVLTLRGCVRVCNTPALQRAHARHAARLDLSRARSGVRIALSRQLALERLQWPSDLAQHWAMLVLQASDSAHRSQGPGNVLIAHSDDIDSGSPQHAARGTRHARRVIKISPPVCNTLRHKACEHLPTGFAEFDPHRLWTTATAVAIFSPLPCQTLCE
ncbi:hypothetical protein FHY11_001429 [Xanthomonas arboricola]|uniref:hypothetical protein n=1 Tax=Xanthomonas euroxanthea TaxID=2259622 RepID=UPI00141B8105|nr:hypothetical protein [Xanthomonas euroxanthea]NIK07963.1 hypothetical protein [Xanthomonas euroxanthea]